MLPRMTNASTPSTVIAPLLTVPEVAAALRTDPSCVYRHIRAGRLGAVRFGGAVRVPVAAVHDFLVPTRESDDG